MLYKRRLCVAALVIVLLVAVQCRNSMPGLETEYVAYDGLARSYALYVPASYDGQNAVPLLVALHPFLSSGPGFARMTGFNAIAEREGFVVAYPNGRGRRFNALDEDGTDDLGFILEVVERVKQAYKVDPSRVFVTGASNGAFMTYRLACKAADVFAAAAAVMGTMPQEIASNCAPSLPMPMLMIHGTEDPIVPYNAEEVFAGPGMTLRQLSMPDTVAFWVNLNGCAQQPDSEALPDADPADGTTVTVDRYRGGQAGVVLYRVEGGGHTWPGGQRVGPEWLVGRLCADFSASEAIWAFFAGQSR
jgi:polyhydroxybutyrate depolymerase